jgi:hypothetical protein
MATEFWSSTGSASLIDAAGCLHCPAGSSRKDLEGILSVAETRTKEILSTDVKVVDLPMLFTESMPIGEPENIRCDAYTNTYSVYWPEAQATDTCPVTSEVSGEVVSNGPCGDETFSYTGASSSGLLCDLPMGPGGVVGKQSSFGQEFLSTYSIGPFCIDKMWRESSAEDLTMLMRAYMDAAPRFAHYGLEKETVRRLIEGSRFNVSAIAGRDHKDLRFSTGGPSEVPTSQGSLDMLRAIADRICIYGSRDGDIEICVSPQTMEYWIRDYAVQNGVDLNASFGTLGTEVRQRLGQVGDGEDLVLRSLKYPKRFRISQKHSALYVHMTATGGWSYQEYNYLEAGDAVEGGGAPTPVRSEFWGEPCFRCPTTGEIKETYEIIPIYDRGSVRFHGFANNPVAAALFRNDEIEADLWGKLASGEMRFYFGNTAKDVINENSFAPNGCRIDNRLNQWFIGEYILGRRIREGEGDLKKAMGFLWVKLGGVTRNLDEAVCGLSGCAPAEGTAIVADRPGPTTECEPDEVFAPRDCCLHVQVSSYTLQTDAVQTITVEVQRDCADQTATVDYAFVDGTATNGVDYTGVDGTLNFAEGEVRKTITYDVEIDTSIENGTATIDWTGADLCTDPDTTDIVINNCPAAPAADDDCPCE